MVHGGPSINYDPGWSVDDKHFLPHKVVKGGQNCNLTSIRPAIVKLPNNAFRKGNVANYIVWAIRYGFYAG